ncbi:hypothetical protein BJV77DRAFT_564384 [Russula vinacea]|nr:hypothetical protein BJV77DRAFT_564384 [Russula vinacea]
MILIWPRCREGHLFILNLQQSINGKNAVFTPRVVLLELYHTDELHNRRLAMHEEGKQPSGILRLPSQKCGDVFSAFNPLITPSPTRVLDHYAYKHPVLSADVVFARHLERRRGRRWKCRINQSISACKMSRDFIRCRGGGSALVQLMHSAAIFSARGTGANIQDEIFHNMCTQWLRSAFPIPSTAWFRIMRR